MNKGIPAWAGRGCGGVYLRSPALQLLQLSVVQVSSRREHLRELQLAVHQAADGVAGVTPMQRHVDAVQRRVC